MKHQLRRIQQIHARLLGDLRLPDRRAAEIRAERAQRAVVARPAVEIDDEHRRAERLGMAQDAQPRPAAEIIGDQLAQMRIARSRCHYAAAGSAPAAASAATVSANWPSASRPRSDSA